MVPSAWTWTHFPGWTASIDGVPVSIAVTEPHGQISVEVPPGEHHLVVWFGSTPLRMAATLVSLVGMAVLGLAFFAVWRYNIGQSDGGSGDLALESGTGDSVCQ
jgi:hypothetical protein